MDTVDLKKIYVCNEPITIGPVVQLCEDSLLGKDVRKGQNETFSICGVLEMFLNLVHVLSSP